MNALTEIKSRFSQVLASMVDADHRNLLGMIRPTQDLKFGDYQANCAMPMKGMLKMPPVEIANSMIEQLSIDDLCQKVEVAGPGFINLTLDDDWLKSKLKLALQDERLGVTEVTVAKTYVVDFSSPNVAKPLHVGHIRSTVIGDAIARILRFVGHQVITDNHLGDWGTQFGMIIYGYKHFCNPDQYKQDPIAELGRLYKLVRQLMDYHGAKTKLPEAKELLEKQQAAQSRIEQEAQSDDKGVVKKAKKDLKAIAKKIKSQTELVSALQKKFDSVESDSNLKQQAEHHPSIATAVLTETAKLHEEDAENLELWNQFLPHCQEAIDKIYSRLGIKFDHQFGESFYHNQLSRVVESFESKGLARESDGATCIFMDDYDTPMIIRKKDGAFLYATTDLATIKYRMDTWSPDAILYVVDHRQHEHFEKLFDAARLWGYQDVELTHVQFGTVLGKDGKPFKTRDGDVVGFEGLLNTAEEQAGQVASGQNEALEPDQLGRIAAVVGLGGLKYIDLSHNRTSDYEFSYEKMLALRGNTATYLQYGFARVNGIFRRGEIDIRQIRENPVDFIFKEPIERKLAVSLIQFGETLDEVLVEYKPNLLTTYLFELAQTYATFFESCPVLKAEDEALRNSRLQLCDLTARTIRRGLELLGIETLEQM